MSFAQPFSESHRIQTDIQIAKTDGDSGGASSPVKTPGGNSPGTAEKPPISEMNPRRTTLKPGTSGMRRSWY